MTKKHILWPSVTALLLTLSQPAMADSYDPSQCEDDVHQRKKGSLGKINGSPVTFSADTCQEGDLHEHILKVKVGKKTQRLTKGAHGATGANDYKWSLRGKRLKLVYGCASRFDDPGRRCTSTWQWQSKQKTFKYLKTTVYNPRRAALKKIKADLDKGKIRKAYKALKKVDPSSSGGHTDERNQLIGMFIEGVHKQALKLHKAKKTKQAAKLIELVFDAPVYKGSIDTDPKTTICFDRKCVDRYDIGGSEAEARRLVDMAYILDEVGKHEQAYLLFKQLSPHLTNYAPVWLNLADAAWSTGKKKEARAAYKKYQTLRLAQKRAVPERVKLRLKTPQK